MYKKDIIYKIKYIDKQGKNIEEEFTPDKDMTIAGVITALKNSKDDFFKLIEIDEIKLENKLTEGIDFGILDTYLQDGIDMTDEDKEKLNNAKDLYEQAYAEYTEISKNIRDIIDRCYKGSSYITSMLKEPFDTLSSIIETINTNNNYTEFSDIDK